MTKLTPWPGIKPEPIATVAEIECVRACIAGAATADQAKIAIDWIMREAARVTDLSYRPGDPNATMFAEGRRYAGICIRYCLEPEFLQRARARFNQERQE